MGSLLYVLVAIQTTVWPGLQEVKVPVTFRFTPEKPAEIVYLAGTFNEWQFRQHPMKSEDGGRTWSLTLDLPPGAHQYKFVLNGTEWRTDPNALQTIDDGFGNLNSVIWVEPEGYGMPAKVGDGQITRSAILHRPDDLRDRNPIGKRLLLTVRTRRDDLEKVELLLRSKGKTGTKSLELVAQDGLFAYYRAELPNKACEYVFRLIDGPYSLWLSPAGLTTDPSKAFFQYKPPSQKINPTSLPHHLTTPPPFIIPEWMPDAIFYQIVPDRFFNANPKNDPENGQPLDETGRTDLFFGGDLQGILQKLDYIQSLGVNALYLNPVFASVTHHNYDTDDYERIDPQLGSEKEFKQLAKQLKSRGIRLILDGVFNHVGIGFFAFRDLLQNQEQSKYKDWFKVVRFPVKVAYPPNYWAWWNIPYMPKLNHENPEVRAYLLKVVARWTDRVPFDGWRLDVPNEVPDAFWREFRQVVKKEDPQAVIIGEIWGDAGHWLQGDMFDSVMNYRWRGAVLDWIAYRRILPSQFDQRLQALKVSYPVQAYSALYNLLSSHDTPRLRTECGGDWARVRLAFLVQMTSPGAPAIYYGDEVGMEGGRIPDNRRPMEWNPTPEGKQLLEYVKDLIQLRRNLSVLRRGEWRTLLTDDKQNVYAYARYKSRSVALVVINNGTQEARVNVPLPFKAETLQLVLTSGGASQELPANYNLKEGYVNLTLPPMTGVVLTNGRS